MGERLKLKCQDGVEISSYLAKPDASPRGAIVILQEIMGINHHIRTLCDCYAKASYVAIAPALFDRVEKEVELGYGPTDITRGGEIRGKTDPEKTKLDIIAAIEAAKSYGKVGLVGYCWGGTLSYQAACGAPDLSAAVAYYGGGIANLLDKKPKIPLLLHFGSNDASIPLSDVNKIKAALPDVPLYLYEAGHGFNCDERGAYDQACSDLALQRTMDFLAQHIG